MANDRVAFRFVYKLRHAAGRGNGLRKCDSLEQGRGKDHV